MFYPIERSHFVFHFDWWVLSVFGLFLVLSMFLTLTVANGEKAISDDFISGFCVEFIKGSLFYVMPEPPCRRLRVCLECISIIFDC